MVEQNTKRLLAHNPQSGNGADYHRIEELASRYGYALLNLAEIFETVPTPDCDKRLKQVLESYDLVAVSAGDGTFLSLLRNSRPDARLLHLPNGGFNVVGTKLSNWKHYSHERILQAVADHNYRIIELRQGVVENKTSSVPETFYWTVGTGLSSDLLSAINRFRKHEKHIRHILAGAVSFYSALQQGQFYTALVNGQHVRGQGFDVIKGDMPYYGPLELHKIHGLNLNLSDVLITYGVDSEPNNPMHPIRYIANFLQDALAINIGHRIPTRGMIRLMPIPHGSSVTFQPENNSSQHYPHIDSEIYAARGDVSAIPYPDNPQISRLIGRRDK